MDIELSLPLPLPLPPPPLPPSTIVKLQESRYDTKRRGPREVINSILIPLTSDWSGTDGQALSLMLVALWTIIGVNASLYAVISKI